MTAAAVTGAAGTGAAEDTATSGAVADWDLLDEAGLWDDASDFVTACRRAPTHLLYFLLNVGDGDMQLLVLPEHAGARRALVVDAARVDKLPALLAALAEAGILTEPADGRPGIPLVVATHPHSDHIGGMPQLLRRSGHQIGELWEPGYWHPTDTYVETMVALEEASTAGHAIQRTHPTSGLTRFMGGVKVTVLTPGVRLRGHFDTLGTEINDASISLKIEFPASRVVARDPEDPGASHRNRHYLKLEEPWSLVLGADSQTTSWAQATVDFPQLHAGHRRELHRALEAARGRDPLRGHVFKVPHHGSKHGVNLELVERIRPWLSLVSSTPDGERYHFPHHLAVEALREAVQPATDGTTVRARDHQLGIHYTCGRLTPHGGGRAPGTGGTAAPARPMGSIALMISPRRKAPTRAGLRMWRFFDAADDDVDLSAGRLLTDYRGVTTD